MKGEKLRKELPALLGFAAALAYLCAFGAVITAAAVIRVKCPGRFWMPVAIAAFMLLWVSIDHFERARDAFSRGWDPL